MHSGFVPNMLLFDICKVLFYFLATLTLVKVEEMDTTTKIHYLHIHNSACKVSTSKLQNRDRVAMSIVKPMVCQMEKVKRIFTLLAQGCPWFKIKGLTNVSPNSCLSKCASSRMSHIKSRNKCESSNCFGSIISCNVVDVVA